MSAAPTPKVHEEAHEHDKAFKPTRVLCIPVDESESTIHTIQYSIKTLINKETDQIVLLNTRPPVFNDFSLELTGLPYVIPSAEIEKVEIHSRDFSHSLLKKSAKYFQDQNIHVRAISLRGDPREELEYKIGELKPDFVIMGSRGLNAFTRVMLGSVSEHMIHHLKCPVMVVPFTPEDAKKK